MKAMLGAAPLSPSCRGLFLGVLASFSWYMDCKLHFDSWVLTGPAIILLVCGHRFFPVALNCVSWTSELAAVYI